MQPKLELVEPKWRRKHKIIYDDLCFITRVAQAVVLKRALVFVPLNNTPWNRYGCAYTRTHKGNITIESRSGITQRGKTIFDINGWPAADVYEHNRDPIEIENQCSSSSAH